MTYTDGAGAFGEGIWLDGQIRRGRESRIDRPSEASIAVAPPKQKDRQRFCVEKAQELGLAELWWLETAHGEGRVPSPSKSMAWATAALEQSRGAWLLGIGGPVKLEGLGPVVGCDSGGTPIDSVTLDLAEDATIAIGPEGGWSEAELGRFETTVSLGPTVLRVETAVVVAGTLIRRATLR